MFAWICCANGIWNNSPDDTLWSVRERIHSDLTYSLYVPGFFEVIFFSHNIGRKFYFTFCYLIYTVLLFILYLFAIYLIRNGLAGAIITVIRIQHEATWNFMVSRIAFIFLRSRPDCFCSAGFRNYVQLCKYREKMPSIFFFHIHKNKRWLSIERNIFFINMLCARKEDRRGKKTGEKRNNAKYYSLVVLSGQKEKHQSTLYTKRVLRLCLPLNKLKILDFFNFDVDCKLLISGLLFYSDRAFLSVWKLSGTCVSIIDFRRFFILFSTHRHVRVIGNSVPPIDL